MIVYLMLVALHQARLLQNVNLAHAFPYTGVLDINSVAVIAYIIMTQCLYIWIFNPHPDVA